MPSSAQYIITITSIGPGIVVAGAIYFIEVELILVTIPSLDPNSTLNFHELHVVAIPVLYSL